MIDTKAAPIEMTDFNQSPVPVGERMRLTFNALATVSVVLSALIPLALGAYWLFVGYEEVLLAGKLSRQILPEFTLGQRLLAALVSVLAVLPLSWGLLRLRSCFSEFSQGRPFSRRSTAGLRDFAAAIIGAVVAKIFAFTLLRLVLTWTAPPGMKQFAIAIDSDSILMALFAAIVAALAWAMGHAAALAEENSQFV
jgi:hypothetical protein